MIALWVLAGCTSLDEQDALFLRGAGFDWVAFNHRVSALRFGFAGQQAELAVIGGTSTTGQSADLDATCDEATCSEIPFDDTSDVRLGWGRLTTDAVALGRGSAMLDVPRDGGSTTIDVALPAVPSGEITAVLSGFGFDTARALSGGPACYRPEYGWHPLRMSLSIDGVSVDGDIATVSVSGRFDPGPALEPERLCIDEVYEQAVVGVEIDVLVLAGVDTVTDEPVTSSATYSYGDGPFEPDPQAVVEPTPLDARAPVMGWASVDYTFDSGDGRGAYLRQFGFELVDDGARGITTNFSPITQLTGLSYTFEGTVRAVQLDGAVETGTLEVAGLEPDLAPDGSVIGQRFPR